MTLGEVTAILAVCYENSAARRQRFYPSSSIPKSALSRNPFSLF
jgi:hypothetical protein